MTFSLIWLADVLRKAGLDVVEVPGWQHRGTHGSDMGSIEGVILHHTACGSAKGDMPSLGTLKSGRSDLPGPLSQLGLGRKGDWYVVAAGRCNHAGRGLWKGIRAGNTHLIGIEAENSGFIHGPLAEPWPDVQIESYAKGVAAILNHIGKDESWAVRHAEYALPKGRKTDASFDGDWFRAKVKKYQEELSK